MFAQQNQTSWKTTVLGLISIALAIAPVWVPDKYAPKFQQTVGIVSGLGLISAKDNSKQ